MNTQTAGYLVIFGMVTILLGVIVYQTHPENAPIALIFGGSLGALSILWGILGAKGARWSWTAALLTAALLGLACVWRSSLGWLAVASGEAARGFASLVNTLMLGVSGLMLWFLIRDRRAAKPPPADPAAAGKAGHD